MYWKGWNECKENDLDAIACMKSFQIGFAYLFMYFKYKYS
jgi:hypothetical protein